MAAAQMRAAGMIRVGRAYSDGRSSRGGGNGAVAALRACALRFLRFSRSAAARRAARWSFASSSAMPALYALRASLDNAPRLRSRRASPDGQSAAVAQW